MPSPQIRSAWTLVGCRVVLPWKDNSNKRQRTSASLCVVDGYAADAPGGPSYLVSWVGNRDEYYLMTATRLSEMGAQCSADVQDKLAGACATSVAHFGMASR